MGRAAPSKSSRRSCRKASRPRLASLVALLVRQMRSQARRDDGSIWLGCSTGLPIHSGCRIRDATRQDVHDPGQALTYGDVIGGPLLHSQ